MVRDAEQIDDVLRELKKAWKKNPQLRLMQLLLNTTPNQVDQYFIEDERLVARLHAVYGASK